MEWGYDTPQSGGYSRWCTDVGMCAGCFARKCYWSLGMGVMPRGFRKRCQCLIRIAEVFFKLPMVSMKDLFCWNFNDIGLGF